MFVDSFGTLISIAFVIVIIGTGEILKKKGILGDESARKFIHIGVSHWWIIAMYMIHSLSFAMLPPLLFIIINYMSYKKGLIGSMERGDEDRDLGTVYFPISLFVLVLLTWHGGLLKGATPLIGALGMLVMGYGDGLAALVGKKFGTTGLVVFGQRKTIEGSLTMFSASLVVIIGILTILIGFDLEMVLYAFLLATLATLIEFITPFSMDNLTVPLITSGVAFLLVSIPISNESISILSRFLVGAGFSSIIAYLAYRKGSLSMSGAVGAVLLGTGIFMTGGLYSAGLMVLFFITSSGLSHFKKRQKEVVSEQFDKTGKRDIYQVFANGGIGLLYSIMYALLKEPIYLILIAVAFSAANADTWSTELGVLNKSKPISLRSFKRVEKGTSGAISIWGTFAGLLGAGFIGISSVVLLYILEIEVETFNLVHIFLWISIGGFLGGMVDSILGGTLQAIYYSDVLDRETEKRMVSGTPAELIRGYRLFNNDLINLLSISIATIIVYGMVS